MRPILDRCTNCAVRCKECVNCECGENYVPLGAGACRKVVVERFEDCLDLIPDSFVKSRKV